MRGFRGLADLARRMGLSFEDGGAVTDLPYAEGQVLATITDDWTRVRTEPVINTFGVRCTLAAGGAGVNSYAILTAVQFPLRIVWISPDAEGAAFPVGSSPVLIGQPDQTFVPGAAAVASASPFLLEGANRRILSSGLVQMITGLDFTLEYFSTGINAPLSYVNHQGFRIIQEANIFGNGFGNFFPLILLPGQRLAISAFAANTGLVFNMVLQQFQGNGDVLTSTPPPPVIP